MTARRLPCARRVGDAEPWWLLGALLAAAWIILRVADCGQAVEPAHAGSASGCLTTADCPACAAGCAKWCWRSQCGCACPNTTTCGGAP